MQLRISDEVKAAYPTLRLASLEIRGMGIGIGSEVNTRRIAEASDEIRRTLTLEAVKDRADFRAYRDFFWKIGVDPTKTRPAAEALVRRILGKSTVPRINDFVDAYNVASILTGVPIAAFDLDGIEDDVILRSAAEGERFLGIGMPQPKATVAGQLVMSSGEELLAIYPYRDAEQSKITAETVDCLLISCGVPGIDIAALQMAAASSRDNVISVCGGHPTRISTI